MQDPTVQYDVERLRESVKTVGNLALIFALKGEQNRVYRMWRLGRRMTVKADELELRGEVFHEAVA